MDLYLITHVPTDGVYVGVTYKHGKTAHDRFEDHMCGCGSIAIKELIALGSSRDDFILDVYYTTNGVIPTNTSSKYTSPISITKNTNFLIIAYKSSNNSYSRIVEYFAEVPKNYRDNLFDSTIYNKKED